jgi:hypothetical protein
VAATRPFLAALDARCPGAAAEWTSALLTRDADVEAAAECAARFAAAQGALCVELELCPASLGTAHDHATDAAAAAERAVAAAAAGLARGAASSEMLVRGGPRVALQLRITDASQNVSFAVRAGAAAAGWRAALRRGAAGGAVCHVSAVRRLRRRPRNLRPRRYWPKRR